MTLLVHVSEPRRFVRARNADPLVPQVAARQGIDIPHMVGADTVLKKLNLWERTQNNPWFVSSFALTFTLAAFVRL